MGEVLLPISLQGGVSALVIRFYYKPRIQMVNTIIKLKDLCTGFQKYNLNLLATYIKVVINILIAAYGHCG